MGMIRVQAPWKFQPQGQVSLDPKYADCCTTAIRASTWAVNQVFDDASNSYLQITRRTADGTDGGRFVDPVHGSYFRTDHSTSGPYYGGRVIFGTKVAERFSTGKLTLLLVTNREAAAKQQAIFGNPSGAPVPAGNLAWQWWDDTKHYIDVGNESQRVMFNDASSGLHVYLLSWDNATKRKRLVRNGVVLLEDTAEVDNIAASASACQGLCNGVGTYFFAAFDTVYSKETEIALTLDPWQVYQPRTIWVPQTEMVLPTLSLPTYVPGSLTATGFRPRVTAT